MILGCVVSAVMGGVVHLAKHILRRRKINPHQVSRFCEWRFQKLKFNCFKIFQNVIEIPPENSPLNERRLSLSHPQFDTVSLVSDIFYFYFGYTKM